MIETLRVRNHRLLTSILIQTRHRPLVQRRHRLLHRPAELFIHPVHGFPRALLLLSQRPLPSIVLLLRFIHFLRGIVQIFQSGFHPRIHLFLLPHQIRVSLVHPPPRGERLRFLRSKSRIQRGIFQRQNRTRRRVIQGRLRPFVVRLPTTTVVAMMMATTMREFWS